MKILKINEFSSATCVRFTEALLTNSYNSVRIYEK